MTQEEKDLLLQDLCARLPYGVKVNAPFTTNKEEKSKGYKINSIHFGVVEWAPILFGEKKQRNSIIIEAFSEKYNQYCSIDIELNNDIEEVKPYLFPLSSMTEEQKVEFDKMAELDIEYSITQIKNDALIWTSGLNRFNWFLKNHFDVYGLIPKGLAIDATGKNIY